MKADLNTLVKHEEQILSVLKEFNEKTNELLENPNLRELGELFKAQETDIKKIVLLDLKSFKAEKEILKTDKELKLEKNTADYEAKARVLESKVNSDFKLLRISHLLYDLLKRHQKQISVFIKQYDSIKTPNDLKKLISEVAKHNKELSKQIQRYEAIETKVLEEEKEEDEKLGDESSPYTRAHPSGTLSFKWIAIIAGTLFVIMIIWLTFFNK